MAGARLEMFVTRDELYERFCERLPNPPRLLMPMERAAMAQAAAENASQFVPGLSFQLRPGLVAEMLRFYDQLRRQGQQAKRFEELIEQALGAGAAEVDRGAARMLLQTRLLARTFSEYERRVLECDACDEHVLRDCLAANAVNPPFRHIVVTVPDWIADPDGLFVADFDLLARMPGVESIDVVTTEALLGSGFHQRIHDWLPGLDEVDFAALIEQTPQERPVLAVPLGAPLEQSWFVHRDREEELVAVARRLSSRSEDLRYERRSTDLEVCQFPDGRRPDLRVRGLDRTAVVYKRPLPYLYLAPVTLGAAGIPYQTSDALPLAAEPASAAVDLVLDVVEGNFTRDAVIALLGSPHFRFVHDGNEVSREARSALDRALGDRRYLGDLQRLETLAATWDAPEAQPALDMALSVARALAPLGEVARASHQIRHLQSFIAAYERPLADDDPFARRERRARAAISTILDDLASADAAHHDPFWIIADLAGAVRRWIELETFEPDAAGTGVRLVDDQAARYGDFDDLTVVGLIENDWPEHQRRNIFYPPSLLKALGWPSEKNRRKAADARFLDLLGSASRRVCLSTFTLDDEILATRSIQLDEVPRARLSSVPEDEDDDPRVFPDEALALVPPILDGLADSAREWAEQRIARRPADLPEFHGRIGTLPARSWSVSALEAYLACPFKFFAQHVLRLTEEPEDEEAMDSRRQGQLAHAVFEAFFSTWQSAGRGAITPANLDQARAMFSDVVDRAVADLPEGEAGLERTRLLGSSVASGLGEAVLRMEAERPVKVVERLLERRLDGDLTTAISSGRRVVTLRGKADRLDLLEDGTFRLIDYKLGRPPNRGQALQLPIYALLAEEQLQHHRGRRWSLAEAVHLAFKGARRVVPLFSSPAQRADVLLDAQERLTATLDGIGRGDFPPAPDDVYLCETCSFAPVCRTDYV